MTPSERENAHSKNFAECQIDAMVRNILANGEHGIMLGVYKDFFLYDMLHIISARQQTETSVARSQALQDIQVEILQVLLMRTR